VNPIPPLLRPTTYAPMPSEPPRREAAAAPEPSRTAGGDTGRREEDRER
jgi:hypothetical protein